MRPHKLSLSVALILVMGWLGLSLQADTRTSSDYTLRDTIGSGGGLSVATGLEMLGHLGGIGSVIKSEANDVTLWNGYITPDVVPGSEAPPYMVTNNFHLGANDTSLEGRAILVMSTGMLTVAGHHQFAALTVLSGGLITHEQGATNSVHLTVAGGILIDYGARIEAKGKGLRGGRDGSSAEYFGYMLGECYLSDNATITRFVQGGAAHGSFATQEPIFNQYNFAPVYGSAIDPVLPGSGGAVTVGYNPNFGPAPVGGSGGGVIRLTAHSIVVNGSISADGGEGSPGGAGAAGAGSGGSINLKLTGGDFSGTGLISARAGFEVNWARSAAGRLAIVGYGNDNFAGTYSPFGSLYRKPAGSGGDLRLEHTELKIATNEVLSVGNLSVPATATNRSTVLNSGILRMTTNHLTVPPLLTLVQDGVIEGTSPSVIGAVTVQSNGVITCSTWRTNWLQFSVSGLLKVDVGGSITASGKGLLGGNAGSTTNYGGFNLGEVYLPDNVTIVRSVQGGAPHGGYFSGEPVYQQALYPQVYGSAFDPVLPGSGGGSTTAYVPSQGPPPVGGSGGGVVRLSAGDMVVDGTISADGGNGFPGGAGQAGAGSGGSIKLQLTGSLSGSGIISAKSGVPAGYPVSGAGRVAIVGYANDNFAGTYSLLGSLYRKPAGSEGDLQLDHTLLTIATNEVFSVGSLSVPATATTRSTVVNAGTLRMTTNHLIVPRLLTLVQDGVIEGTSPSVIGAVTVQSNGVITCSTWRTNWLQFSVSGLLQVDVGGSITAKGKGLLGGNAGSTTNYGGYNLGEVYLPDNATIVRAVQGGAPHGSYFTGEPVYQQALFPQVYGLSLPTSISLVMERC